MIDQDDGVLAEMLSDDLYYCHSSGSLDNRASFLDNVRNGPIQYRTIERSEEHVRLVGPTAFLTGRVAIVVDVAEHRVDLDLRYLAVWTEGETGWAFEAWQSTPVRH
jgi:hypothetical protein